jgi:hypothetical protein
VPAMRIFRAIVVRRPVTGRAEVVVATNPNPSPRSGQGRGVSRAAAV